MASSSNNNTSWLRTFMDKNFLKEDGSNFHEWESNLRLAVEADGKQEFIFQPPPTPPDLHSNGNVVEAFKAYKQESLGIKNVLIFSMAPSLQRRFIYNPAHEIYVKLVDMFSTKPLDLVYDASVRFFKARLERGQPVSPHVLQIIEYADILNSLNHPVTLQMATDRILHSLHDGFIPFRVNYNMNQLQMSLQELHQSLCQAEKDMAARGGGKEDVLSVNFLGRQI